MKDEPNTSVDPDHLVATGSAGVVQRTVIRGELPALIVVHDDEGDWLIGDGINDPNLDGACGIYHLGHVIGLDESLAEAMTIPSGFAATRESASSPWTVSRWEYSE